MYSYIVLTKSFKQLVLKQLMKTAIIFYLKNFPMYGKFYYNVMNNIYSNGQLITIYTAAVAVVFI